MSTIATLEAAVKWPDSVTYVSAIFFSAAVVRSVAMWYVLNTHAARLDDIEATLTAYRGCDSSPLAEICAPQMPWWERFAVSISLGHLLQFEPNGVEPTKLVRQLTPCTVGDRCCMQTAPLQVPPVLIVACRSDTFC